MSWILSKDAETFYNELHETRERCWALEDENKRLQDALSTLGERYQAVLKSHRDIREEMRERCAASVEKDWDIGDIIAEAIRALPLESEDR